MGRELEVMLGQKIQPSLFPVASGVTADPVFGAYHYSKDALHHGQNPKAEPV